MNKYIKWILRFLTGILALFFCLMSYAASFPPMAEYDCERHNDLPVVYIHILTAGFVGLFILTWYITAGRKNEM